mmetsp:Transcript_8527/g.14951  ORF Transcript_8527/g.14951 Transcript_8527/m.14951 type:complete len:416 (-) Transcript_8527:192-1439(-)
MITTTSSPTSILSLQGMMERAKLSACGACSMPQSYQRQADDGDTSATIKSSDSDGGSVGFPSQHSTASCCSIHSHITSNDEIRKRYLRRLGILADPNKRPAAVYTDIGGASQQQHQQQQGPLTSGGANPKVGCIQKHPSHSSLSQSSSHGAMPTGQQMCNSQEKIILMRCSVEYTTKLKSDPTDAIESNQFISKTSREEGNDENMAPRSSPSKFELSSAWASLLSKDSASTTSASSEPLDGAYDLFSLPSDSSITANRCDSNRSLNNMVALDRLPSRDDLSLSSMPRQRKVSFDSTVKAATIPSRFSYSSRIHTRLWSSTEDIHANAVRNDKEYVFDGSNWRTAREESDFLRCSSVSSSSLEELVHPVHFRGWSCSPPSCQHEQSLPSTRNKEDDNADDRATSDGDDSGGMFEMD